MGQQPVYIPQIKLPEWVPDWLKSALEPDISDAVNPIGMGGPASPLVGMAVKTAKKVAPAVPDVLQQAFKAVADKVSEIRAFSLDMGESARLQRARDQGYTIDALHGRVGDYSEVAIPSWKRQTDAGDLGEGFYAAPANDMGAETASFYADRGAGLKGANVMPVKMRIQNPLIVRRDPARPLDDPRPMAMQRLSEEWGLSERPKFNGAKQTNEAWASEFSEHLRRRGHDGAVVQGRDGEAWEYMVLNPSQVRSRFAAFDPAKVGSGDLMSALTLAAGAATQIDRDRE